jgi:hypothetical protein
MNNFFAELKRRNVVRMAGLYAWLGRFEFTLGRKR